MEKDGCDIEALVEGMPTHAVHSPMDSKIPEFQKIADACQAAAPSEPASPCDERHALPGVPSPSRSRSLTQQQSSRRQASRNRTLAASIEEAHASVTCDSPLAVEVQIPELALNVRADSESLKLSEPENDIRTDPERSIPTSAAESEPSKALSEPENSGRADHESSRPPSEPENEFPNSHISTPELPLRELPADADSAAAASFLYQQLRMPGPEAKLSAAVHPMAVPSRRMAWYRVAFIGGISVREAPDVMAPTTGETLPCNEVFAITESCLGVDQRLYLRLASGMGWVFDDSLLIPEDPSVVQLAPAFEDGNCVANTGLQARHGAAAGYAALPAVYGGGERAMSFPSMTSSSHCSASPLATTPSMQMNGVSVNSACVVPQSRWYRVEFCGGISVRTAPDVDAQRTGVTMPCGEVFEVSEEVPGNDQRLYLRLADGRGWVFDDRLLMPDDCSVVPIQPPLVQYAQEYLLPQRSHGAHTTSSTGARSGQTPKSKKKGGQPREPSPSQSKSKESKGNGHVPYWVRMHRAKLQKARAANAQGQAKAHPTKN